MNQKDFMAESGSSTMRTRYRRGEGYGQPLYLSKFLRPEHVLEAWDRLVVPMKLILVKG